MRSGKELESPSEKKCTEEEPVPIESEQTSKGKEGVEEEKEKLYVPPPPYKPLISFPRLAKSKSEGQFKKFVELLKKLYVNIPFIEAIIQMPSYAKFLKENLTNKRKIDDDDTIALTEECRCHLN